MQLISQRQAKLPAEQTPSAQLGKEQHSGLHSALARMTVHGKEALMPAKYQAARAKMRGLNLT